MLIKVFKDTHWHLVSFQLLNLTVVVFSCNIIKQCLKLYVWLIKNRFYFRILSKTSISVDELKVLRISFSDVTTSRLTVSWISPSSADQINHYKVSWSPTDNSHSGGNSKVPKSSSSFVITDGVTAGKTYTVTVSSINTETRVDHLRTTSLSETQALSMITFIWSNFKYN